MRERTELLGIDHDAYGALTVRTQAGGRTACAISAGGEYVRVRKGDLPVPNEDACGAIDDDDRTLLVVADGHFGHVASHQLCARTLAGPIPKNPLELLQRLSALADPHAEPDRSATTLLLAVYSRATGRGFGVSYGDSSLVVVRPSGAPLVATRKEASFVNAWDCDLLDPHRAGEFEFAVPEGAVVVGFSDGIDECCYGDPERSVWLEDLHGLWVQAGDAEQGVSGVPAVPAYVEALGALALAGVRGHPGGQDNLSVVATR